MVESTAGDAGLTVRNQCLFGSVEISSCLLARSKIDLESATVCSDRFKTNKFEFFRVEQLPRKQFLDNLEGFRLDHRFLQCRFDAPATKHRTLAKARKRR